MENINDFEFERDFAIENLQKLRAHYAGMKRDIHPRMMPFLEKGKRNLYVFDLQKTLQKITSMVEKIKEIEAKKQKILFVCNNKTTINFLEKYIKNTNHFYIDNRWLGGILTNFDHLQKRIILLQEMNKKKQKGTLELLTKKERLHFQRKKNSLEINLKGILGMKVLPNYIFIVNPFFQKIAFQESKKKNIPILALCRANVNPEYFEEFVPINDNSFETLDLFFKYLQKDVLEEKESKKKLNIEQKETNLQPNEKKTSNGIREKIIQELENKNG